VNDARPAGSGAGAGTGTRQRMVTGAVHGRDGWPVEPATVTLVGPSGRRCGDRGGTSRPTGVDTVPRRSVTGGCRAAGPARADTGGHLAYQAGSDPGAPGIDDLTDPDLAVRDPVLDVPVPSDDARTGGRGR
jgi:hypothetical protein